MRFSTTSLLLLGATLTSTSAMMQHPISVYLHPSPQSSSSSGPGAHHIPTLTDDQARAVIGHHFGAVNAHDAVEFEGVGKKGWEHLVGVYEGGKVKEGEKGRVIVIQADVVPTDVIPPTLHPSHPSFHLSPFPSPHSMQFIQPYFNRAQQVVKHLAHLFEEKLPSLDNLEEGFDKVWGGVKEVGGKVGLGNVFDLDGSESAKLLHTQLQTLQEFATPSFLTKHMSDSPSRFVWESTAITALGSPEDTGVEGETRKVGMEVLKGSLQAMTSDSNAPPLVIILVPMSRTTPFKHYYKRAQSLYIDLKSQARESKIIQAIPLEALGLTSLAGLSRGWLVGLAVGLVPGLLALATVLNVLRQLLVPQDPTLPPQVFHFVPFLGNGVAYGMDPYTFLFACREKYGDIFTFTMVGRKMTVALGPKGNNMVLGGKLSQVSAEDAYTHLTTPVFGKGVVYDCPNDMLMQQKRMVKFGLSTENFISYVPMIEDETKNYITNDLKASKTEWKSCSILHNLQELIIFTAARTLQGQEVRQKMDKHFARLMEHLDGGFTPVHWAFPNLPLPSYRKRDHARKWMSEFYQQIVRDRRSGESEHSADMIEALMNSEYRDGTPLSDMEVAHMLIALLMAGQHTSSATSSWALLRLAERPDIYEGLYQEQKEVFGQPDGSFRPMAYEDLKKMPRMDAVIRETLRMHPPLHTIMRLAISDIPVPATLGAPAGSNDNATYVVPKGHYLLAIPGVSSMDPKIWPEALTWEPTRWTDEKGFANQALEQYMAGDKVDYGFGSVSKGTESPYAPFGAGRHRCIGESFAYVQLQTLISFFVQRLELKLDGPFPGANFQTMVVLPLPGTKLMYKERS